MVERIEASLKHERLKSILVEALDRGEYSPGDQLPSQNEMAETYHVSHNTVREALASLVHEGRLYRIQGKGTFVADRKPLPINIAVVMPHLYLATPDDDIVISDIVPRLVCAVEDEARQFGANIVLYLSNDDPTMERENLLNLVDRGADAAIVFYIGADENADCLVRIKESGIPLVLMDRYHAGAGFHHVGTDNRNGVRRAISAFRDSGFTSVYYLDHESPHVSSTEIDRLEGYREACREYAMEQRILRLGFQADIMITSNKCMYEAALELLSRIDERPFAVFAQNAPVLSWIWWAIDEAGIAHSDCALGCFDQPYSRVPEDLLFVKVVQSLELIGRRAVQIAMARPAAYSAVQHITLEPDIRVLNRSNGV